MKAIKIYLIVVTVLLILAVGAGIYVWYLVQKLNTATGAVQPISTTTSSAEVPREPHAEQTTSQDSSETTLPVTPTPTPSPSVNTEVKEEPIVIDIETMNPSQKKLLESLGYTGGSFTITPTMIACAEDAVGRARLDEIVNGSAPTPLESLKLLPCFKS